MTWLEACGKDDEPDFQRISAFIDSPHWEALNNYLQNAYVVTPKVTFSGCSGQPGWNVKYQKAGKALCTLYPMPGSFIALVVVGEKERNEVELLLPTFSPYVQQLYQASCQLMGVSWLMVSVTDAQVLGDVKRLIAIRRTPDHSMSAGV